MRLNLSAIQTLGLAAFCTTVAAGSVAQAQTSPSNCPTSATSCSVNNQTVGDTSNPSSASGTTSNSSLSGTSAASNSSAANVTISPTNNPQTNQNSTNTTTGTISGGNTTSNAAGGSSTGNSTTATNTNSTGPSTASSGNNTLGGATASTGANTNTLTGAAITTGPSNTATTVDASNHSISNERVIFIPPVVPATPPSSLAIGNIVKDTGACGPLQRVLREPVQGTFFGLVKNARVQQGYTEYLMPYVDEHGAPQAYHSVPLANGGYRLFGHQVTQYTTVIGVSGVRNIAFGGGGNGGAWGQGGMGTSGSMQQMVTTIQLRDCEVGAFIPQDIPRPPVIYVEPKRIRQ